MQSYWFGDVEGTSYQPFDGSVEELVERIKNLRVDIEEFVPLEWEIARQCGVAATREEYLDKVKAVCVFMARQNVASYYQRRDVKLIHMVRMLDGIDEATNRLTEDAIEWYRTQDPSFSMKYRKIPHRQVTDMMTSGDESFREVKEEIERIANIRAILMKEVARTANEIIPNTSALLGGLVAARLLARCGGLRELSSLPGSSIQVMGASTALFSHLKNGTPSPKHGIIFQNYRVHNAPRQVRGKVARILSSKVAIAARLDYYRGKQCPEFVREAIESVSRARYRT
ncbi:MAG: RNA-processing protein [Methanoregulaceae archaeon]|nr:RNA-processing protein [Methanoregulaceae archaeon]